jgi:outer membrane protein OmpA-like peptidoglycan-associated protein
MKTTYNKIACILLLLSIYITNTKAQQVNTLYFMKNIEERSEYNPAFQPIDNVYWDLPITPNFRFETGNNSVNFNDVIFNQKINGVDSTITFLHPKANKDDFYKKLHANTRVTNDFSLNLIGFGFRVKKNYFTFNITQKLSSSVYLPKDLFKLLMYGTDTTNSTGYNLSKLGANASVYTEFGFGYSRKINDKLTVGATLKYLMGQANFSTKINDFKIVGGIDKWSINGKGTLNASLPLVNIPSKSDGTVNYDSITTTSLSGSNVSDVIFTSNYGFAVDLGATYKILPNLELSAALTDIGFIRWRENLTNTTLNANYEFSGINYQVADDMTDKIDSVKDAFKDAFSSEATHKAYTTYLTAKLNLGAEYSILKDRIGFGLLTTTQYANKTVYPQVTPSVNFRPCDWFSSSLSYSFVNGQFNTIGLGLQLKVLPFNMYFAADYIPFDYYKAKTVNFQAGIVCSINNPKKVGDDDHDGVKNKRDKCPDTPLGYQVDKKGCTVDSDHDGIPDNLDKCPNTPAGVAVDSVGCPLDADKDGVPDYIDKCPNTPTGVAVDTVGCPLDADKDGVPDYMDKCPNTPAGIAVDTVGCPLDADKDGVPDYMDKCPNTPAGMAVDSTGCPFDEDKDGVPDNLDKCPNTPAGVKVDSVGCPLDTDGDGVPDYLDNCPTLKGTIANHGCPEIKAEAKRIFQKALQGIQFQTGKAVIKPSSFPILNQIVKVMQENPSYSIQINGHTDNVGNPDANKKLSTSRANAVMNYLAKKGVAANRMKADGFGDTVPVADNATAKGRTKNRRVEFIVKFEQ